jgi:hypothetical protein
MPVVVLSSREANKGGRPDLGAGPVPPLDYLVGGHVSHSWGAVSLNQQWTVSVVLDRGGEAKLQPITLRLNAYVLRCALHQVRAELHRSRNAGITDACCWALQLGGVVCRKGPEQEQNDTDKEQAESGGVAQYARRD